MTTLTDWRLCIDFGTAASKASLFAADSADVAPSALVHPLRLAAPGDGGYLAPSYLLFDEERLHFGGAAFSLAQDPETQTDPLHSFKTFLGSKDLHRTIDLKLRRNVDPGSQFSQRDALVLYCAYLLRLVEQAVRLDPTLPQGAAEAGRRYAFPQWRDREKTEQLVIRVFDEAAAIASWLGAAIEAPHGLTRGDALRALEEARRAPGAGRMETGVFEAHAAAECHFAFAAEHAPLVLVLDVGAGTTDLTAFECAPSGMSMREIPGARQTSALACDEVDRILVAYLFERARSEKRAGAKQRFWKRLSRRARALKETLFQDGACEVSYENERIRITLADFSRDKQFLAFQRDLSAFYSGGLARIAAHSGKRAGDISVILAGGGSRLPFIQAMARKPGRIKQKLQIAPDVPRWAQSAAFDESFRKQFPQLAISIGGAMAQAPQRAARAP